MYVRMLYIIPQQFTPSDKSISQRNSFYLSLNKTLWTTSSRKSDPSLIQTHSEEQKQKKKKRKSRTILWACYCCCSLFPDKKIPTISQGSNKALFKSRNDIIAVFIGIIQMNGPFREKRETEWTRCRALRPQSPSKLTPPSCFYTAGDEWAPS